MLIYLLFKIHTYTTKYQHITRKRQIQILNFYLSMNYNTLTKITVGKIRIKGLYTIYYILILFRMILNKIKILLH